MDDFVKLPILENPTKNFLDLSGLVIKSTNYVDNLVNDKISQKGVTFLQWKKNKHIDRGDFYLRIKI